MLRAVTSVHSLQVSAGYKVETGQYNPAIDLPGNPLALVKWLLPFLQSDELVKLYGESGIALVIGTIFYLTGVDTYFGTIMLYIGVWHFFEEYGGAQTRIEEVAGKRDQILKAEKEKLQVAEAKKQIENKQRGGNNTNGAFEAQ